MKGYRFSKFTPQNIKLDTFNDLLKLFLEILTYTSGDISEALSWLTHLDKEYKITTPKYGMGDFIEDLKQNGYINDDENNNSITNLTSKTEQSIRKNALEEIFGKLKKTANKGNHNTSFSGGINDDYNSDTRNFEFGDSFEQISFTESLKNAQINHGFDNLKITENDLEVNEREYKAQTSTVLMIDISHSMILYGEDRITPAKKVAMALSELIMKKYAKDTLDIIVFGNDAWQIKIKDLPYLKVGPYHTNTVAGVELAMDILRRRKNANKQIFMITDGKPTCIKEGLRYYKNSFGLDPKILKKTLNLAGQCRRLGIKVTTFMIASDPYLQEFVKEFSQVNNGSAYFSSLKGLGNLIFEDYRKNRKKKF